MEANTHQPPVTEFVESLLSLGGQMTMLLNHMTETKGPPPKESLPDVLRRLLAQVFESELEAEPAELAIAARTLNAAGEAIAENIFIVPPDFADDEPF